MDNLSSKNKALLSGTVVYFIGNVLIQLINIFLLKLITGSIGSAEYGYFNLVVTVDNLVTPILTLQISDAAFRFLIKAPDNDEKNKIFSSGTVIIAVGIAIVSLFILLFSAHVDYPLLVALYIISTNLFAYVQKIVRSLGENKQYVIANLAKSVIYLLLTVIFIANFKMGVAGLFIANCISTYLCIIYLLLKIRVFRFFHIKAINIDTIKSMVKFSAPLMPNTAIWWLQSSANSLILSTQLGLESNGIYSVSLKFASIMHLITNVFNLAWQESAIKEHESAQYREFATDVFNRYIIFILSGVAVLIPLLRLIVPYFIDDSYFAAIQYIPLLLISVAFAALSGFFAEMIVAKDRNIKLLTTNIVGAVTNMIIIATLFKFLEIWSVVISAIVTYVIVSFARFLEVKEDFIFSQIKLKKIVLPVAMIIAIIAVGGILNNIGFIIVLITYVLIAFWLNKNLIAALLMIIIKKSKS